MARHLSLHTHLGVECGNASHRLLALLCLCRIACRLRIGDALQLGALRVVIPVPLLCCTNGLFQRHLPAVLGGGVFPLNRSWEVE